MRPMRFRPCRQRCVQANPRCTPGLPLDGRHDQHDVPHNQRRVGRRNIDGRRDRSFHHTITKGFIMTTRQINMSLIVAFLMVPFRHLQADETIHLTAEEVINIVSQKLDVAQSRKDAEALQAAKDNLPAISSGYGKKVYRYLAPEQTFALELKILQVADRMQDKSYDLTIRPKAGWYGSVPWPPENERPEALRNARLWYPRTPPEYYRPASQRPAQRWPLAGGRALPSGAE